VSDSCMVRAYHQQNLASTMIQEADETSQQALPEAEAGMATLRVGETHKQHNPSCQRQGLSDNTSMPEICCLLSWARCSSASTQTRSTMRSSASNLNWYVISATTLHHLIKSVWVRWCKSLSGSSLPVVSLKRSRACACTGMCGLL